jgi:hypothetical protein
MTVMEVRACSIPPGPYLTNQTYQENAEALRAAPVKVSCLKTTSRHRDVIVAAPLGVRACGCAKLRPGVSDGISVARGIDGP